MRRRLAVQGALLAPMVGEGAVVGVVQFAPMALLAVRDYAYYSGIYLIYAALLTFLLATLCDVWARGVRRRTLRLDDSHAYYAVLAPMAIAAVVVVLPTAAALSKAGTATVAAGAAATLALYRAGSRYYLIAAGSHIRAGAADLLGASVGLAASMVLWAAGNYTLTTALTVWALVNLVSVAASRSVPVLGFSATKEWFSQQRGSIAALIGEASIMNLGSVGTPYAVGAIVGAPGLALHRGATSLAYPVRLILGAVRSRILAGMVPRGPRTHLAVASLAMVLGLGVFSLLLLVKNGFAADESALALVAEHAGAVSTLVAGTTYSTFLQFDARGRMAPRSLLARRCLHTLLILSMTVVAAYAGGLDGMMWGAAAATALTSVVWVQRRSPSNAPEPTLVEDR